MKIDNLTIIIPVNEFNDVTSKYLKTAITSVENQEEVTDTLKPDIILVYASKVEAEIIQFLNENKFKINIISLKNENKTDFQSQINLAVKEVKTTYFSILEFDDEYGITYMKNFYKYTRFIENVDIFLPIIVEVNNDNKAIKLTNEASWAQQLIGENGEVGYLNMNVLSQYTDFKLSGAIIKTKEFINIGGFKSNIELTFMLEFVYRALNNASKIYTIPKIIYKHLSSRIDSLTDKYLKTMTVEERKFWFDIAKKEYNFSNDRVIDKSVLNKVIVEN